MIIRTSGNLMIEVSSERAELIKKALKSGIEYIDIDDIMLKSSTIMSIEKSPAMSKFSTIKTKLCLPASSLSDEQRVINVKRIQQMKQDFLNRVNK